MATRRRPPLAKQVTGNEDHRRSSLANISRQSIASNAGTPGRASNKAQQQLQQPPPSSSNEAEPTDQLMAGPEEDINMSDDEEGGTRIGDIYIPPPIPPYCSTESKGPRLIIKKIENFNFKSYAGKVVLGPFHHVSTIEGT